MWPWEHLAFGYVLFSLWLRLRGRRPPTDEAVLALAVGTQLPDLIDKPGAWLLGVLPSGISLAHSLLFAGPVAVAAIVAGRRRGRSLVGVGFAVGYLSHLAGDVLWPLAVGGSVPTLLWPLQHNPVDTGPFAGRVLELFGRFLAFLWTPKGIVYLGAELAFLFLAVVLWRRDGAPGIGVLGRTGRGSRSDPSEGRGET